MIDSGGRWRSGRLVQPGCEIEVYLLEARLVRAKVGQNGMGELIFVGVDLVLNQMILGAGPKLFARVVKRYLPQIPGSLLEHCPGAYLTKQ